MIEVLLLLTCLIVLIKPVSGYLYWVYSGHLAARYVGVRRLEGVLGNLIGAEDFAPLGWKPYLIQLLVFLCVCFVAVYALLLGQSYLPLNPDGLAVSPSLAFNITASFLTGTNIQTYASETTLTIISQNFGLMLLQFIAPAVDMAVAVALFRSFNTTSETIGNFWQDFFRSVVFVLLPAALIVAIFTLSQGVVQSIAPIIATTLTGDTQTILTGPLASMQSISTLATNGGGFFASNASHPFATPTPLSGFVNLLLILLLPASFFYLFGTMIGDRRQSITLLLVIGLCIAFFAGVIITQEMQPIEEFAALGVDSGAGNMEGKEARFSTTLSALWGALTTSTSNGSAGAAFESFAPLSILAMMLQMLFGEILLGGVGVGVINMLATVIITVFMANLMIGRSPEYMRKKLGVLDIQLAVLMLVIPAVFLFIAISLSVFIPASVEAMQSRDIYGYTESLYAIISAAFNNGSTLGGIHLNNSYYNILLAIGMLVSGILPKVIACRLAGSIASKQILAANAYSVKPYGLMFAILLLLVIVLSALSYLPILILGPISNYMQGLL